jgi:hypothetical protein
MKVIALISFVSRIDGQAYRANEGDELEMPKGADWVKAGLAKKKPAARKKAKPKESASVKAPENAMESKAKAKKG